MSKPAGIITSESQNLTKTQQELNRIEYKRGLNRRGFLRNTGLAGISVVAGSILTSCLGSGHVVSATGVPEADVLNFALNLEYLEANFYQVAVTGNALGSADSGGAGTVSGGAKVTFADSRLADIAAQIADDELKHVRFLRNALGSAAVPQPNINLDALGLGFANDAEFLILARAFEDTGVSAYAGAATLLSGNNLQYAAQILATEAYHAGNIRLEIITKAITDPATDSMDIPPTESAFFPLDSNALAVKRTTSQVLAIVYANSAAGTASGGFYPNGLNGNIKTV
jgi:Ferritin-like domain